MRGGTAKMPEDACVLAPYVFQGVGQNRKPRSIERPRRQKAVVVGGLGKSKDGSRLPGGFDGDGVEELTEKASEECAERAPMNFPQPSFLCPQLLVFGSQAPPPLRI